MKKILLSAVVAFALTPLLFADDVKLEGQAVCAKCELKQAPKCQAALQIKTADGKTETMLTETNTTAKELHDEICKGGKPVTVEGTVTEKDGQKTIKITKYEIK